MVGASLYALPLYIRSSSEESDLPSINTTRKIVDDEDPDIDLEDQLFILKGRAQTLPSI